MPGGNSSCGITNDPPWYEGDGECPDPEPQDEQQNLDFLQRIFDRGASAHLSAQDLADNQQIVQRFIDLVWNWDSGGQYYLGPQIEAIVDHDYVRWRACRIGKGLDRLLLAVIDTRRKVPDLYVQVDGIESNGDMVRVYATVTGTVNSVAQTRQSTTVYQVKNGKVVYSWTYYPVDQALGAEGASAP